MIQSFRDKETEKIWNRERSRKFQAIQDVAQRRLINLATAAALRDLANFPGLRLEKLSGNRKGQFSIRINDQFRVCFRWADDGPRR